jgi:hypothetical protein
MHGCDNYSPFLTSVHSRAFIFSWQLIDASWVCSFYRVIVANTFFSINQSWGDSTISKTIQWLTYENPCKAEK